MGSEKAPINESQEMEGEKKMLNTNENKGEVLYSGQYVMVSRTSNQKLVACPHKIPEFDEGRYLLDMINELRDVYERVTKGGELGDIDVNVLVEFNNILHTIAIGKGGEVRIDPMIPVDYKKIARVIRCADMVGVELTKEDNAVFRGDRVVVVEGEGGLLQAYMRGGLALTSREAMLLGMGELLRECERITGSRDNKVIEVRGLILRRGLAYRPIIRGCNEVTFKLVSGDYVDLVGEADLITFPRSVC